MFPQLILSFITALKHIFNPFKQFILPSRVMMQKKKKNVVFVFLKLRKSNRSIKGWRKKTRTQLGEFLFFFFFYYHLAFPSFPFKLKKNAKRIGK